MSALSEIVLKLIEAGAGKEVIAIVIDGWEAGRGEAEKGPSKAALRQQRYMERKRQAASDDVTTVSNDGNDVSNDAAEKALLLSKNLKQEPPIAPQTERAAKRSRSQGTVIPADWQPKPETRQRWLDRGATDEQIDTEVEKMISWGLANANRGVARKLNWDQALNDRMIDRFPRKPKFELSVETKYREVAKSYPGPNVPAGSAEADAMAAFLEAIKVSSAEEILGGVMGYAAEVKKRPKEDAKFIPSLKRFLLEHRWKNYHAKTPTAAGIPEELWRKQIERFKNGGQWPNMGPAPGYTGCLAPEHLLVEFGYKKMVGTAMSG